MEKHPPLHLSVVSTEKVSNFTYTLQFIFMLLWKKIFITWFLLLTNQS